jgi:tetratricopeptide (TPR) repeat protein
MDDEMPEADNHIQLLQEAVTRAGQQEDPALLCSALTNLGQAYLDIEEAPDALTQFNEALKIANKKMDDKEIRAKLFGFQGLALKMLGNYDMALQSFRKSNGIASNIRHDLLQCDSFLQIGSLQSDMGNQTEAQESYIRAMDIAGKVQDGNRKMRIAGAMADTYHQQRDFKKALEYYGLACDQALALRNRAAECSFLTKMGNVSLSAGEPKTAISQYERALEIASLIKNRGAEINFRQPCFGYPRRERTGYYAFARASVASSAMNHGACSPSATSGGVFSSNQYPWRIVPCACFGR